MTAIALARRGVLQKPGAAAFSPDSVAGLIAWWKADATLYQESGRTTIASADGDPVGSWTDSSPTAGHASAATSANRPVLKTGINGLNGKPVVRFDGVDDRLLATGVSAATKPFTVLAVMKPTNFSTERTVIAASGNGGLEFRFNNDGKTAANRQFLAGIGSSTAATSAGAAVLVGMTYSGAGAFVFRRNGAADGSGTNNQTFAGTTTVIGFNASGTNGFFLGDMAEILKYDSVLSAPDLAAVEAHLVAKYGL